METKPWPDYWIPYHNGRNEACDMQVGPCVCGATHLEREFFVAITAEGFQLHRYGRPVSPLYDPKDLKNFKLWGGVK